MHLDHNLTLKYENEKYILKLKKKDLNLNFAQYLSLTKSADLLSYIFEFYMKFPLNWYIISTDNFNFEKQVKSWTMGRFHILSWESAWFKLGERKGCHKTLSYTYRQTDYLLSIHMISPDSVIHTGVLLNGRQHIAGEK